eukprot:1578908-Rhodomonas_salina.1
MPGTDVAYVATRLESTTCGREFSSRERPRGHIPVVSYAIPRQCPVLILSMMLRFAVRSDTDTGYATMDPYAISGTDIGRYRFLSAYALAMRCPVLSTAMLLCNLYAASGPEIGYAAAIATRHVMRCSSHVVGEGRRRRRGRERRGRRGRASEEEKRRRKR